MTSKRRALTPIEKAIIQRACEGLTDNEIAAELKISYNNVRLNLEKAMIRLDAINRTNLVHIATKKKLTD